jgi:small-conductance mechanosensitive channel
MFMNQIHPIFFVLAGAIVAIILHWFIGNLRRRYSKKDAAHSKYFRPLFIEWAAKGLQTLLWVTYLVFLLKLLPTVRNNFSEARIAIENRLQESLDFLLNNALGAIIILVITVFLMRFVSAFIKSAMELYDERLALKINEATRRRASTLSVIFSGLAQTTIFFIGLMVALQQAGLNITPILASAGIVGLAVGFGAQSLIKDIFAGFIVLLEDQYSVGDTIKIGDVTGTVEALTLRSTRVRGTDGALTIFPNGGINTVANLSKEWMRVVLDFEIDYTSEVDRAMQVMLETAQQLSDERSDEILEAPTMQGIEKVSGGNLVLRLVLKTIPAKQAELARELRRRVKLAFDAAGIIPRKPASTPAETNAESRPQ